MRNLAVSFLILVALGAALLLWRQPAMTPVAPWNQGRRLGKNDPIPAEPGSRTVLIPARGEGWWIRVQEAIRGVGTNAIPSLLTLVTQRTDRTGWIVANAGFQELRSDAAPAVPALMEFLKDTEPDIRSAAADYLGCIGAPASNAAPHLAKALTDPDTEVRRSAVGALRDIPGSPEVLVPALIAYLDGPHGDTNRAAGEKCMALWALHRYARGSSDALSALRRMANDADADVRKYADLFLRDAERPPPLPGEHYYYRGTGQQIR